MSEKLGLRTAGISSCFDLFYPLQYGSTDKSLPYKEYLLSFLKFSYTLDIALHMDPHDMTSFYHRPMYQNPILIGTEASTLRIVRCVLKMKAGLSLVRTCSQSLQWCRQTKQTESPNPFTAIKQAMNIGSYQRLWGSWGRCSWLVRSFIDSCRWCGFWHVLHRSLHPVHIVKKA